MSAVATDVQDARDPLALVLIASFYIGFAVADGRRTVLAGVRFH
jgi:hypothetical protein